MLIIHPYYKAHSHKGDCIILQYNGREGTGRGPGWGGCREGTVVSVNYLILAREEETPT